MKTVELGKESFLDFRIAFEDEEIEVTIRFLPIVQIWVMDIIYKDKTILGTKLSLGVLMFKQFNLPFDFLVTDSRNSGIDPYLENHFRDKIYSLKLIEREELTTSRGYEVE